MAKNKKATYPVDGLDDHQIFLPRAMRIPVKSGGERKKPQRHCFSVVVTVDDGEQVIAEGLTRQAAETMVFGVQWCQRNGKRSNRCDPFVRDSGLVNDFKRSRGIAIPEPASKKS